MKTKRYRKEYLFLFFIILLSYAIRLYGIQVEIPHPDAYVFVEGAMYYGLTDVPPSSKYGFYALYVAPGFTLAILLIMLFSLFFAGGWLLGVFPTLESFELFYQTNIHYFYVLSRFGTVSMGIGSIILVYIIAKRIFGSKTGLLSALFLGVSFMHSMHSQFIRMDVIATFFILLSVLYSLSIIEKQDLKSYILAGLFAGMSIASKYTSGLTIFPIFVAHFLIKSKNLRKGNLSFLKENLIIIPLAILGITLCIFGILVDLSQISLVVAEYLSPGGELGENSLRFLEIVYSKTVYLGIGFILMAVVLKVAKSLNGMAVNLIADKKLIVSMLVVAFSFIIFDPIFLFNLRKIASIFLNDPNFMGENTLFVGVDRLEGIRTHLWYLAGPLLWGAGTPIALLAGAGLLMSIFRLKRFEMVLLTFPLLYFVFIGMGNFKWERYAIPLLPFAAIYAGKFLVDVANKISQFLSRYLQQKEGLLLIGLSLILIINPIYNILRYDYLLTQADTRTLSEQWAKKHIPLKSKIGQDHYTGNLPGDMFIITKQYSLSQGKNLIDYRNEGFHYLFVSSTMYDRYFAEPEKYSKNIEFYQQLFKECELVKEFEPAPHFWPPPGERFLKYHIHTSPTIKILKL